MQKILRILNRLNVGGPTYNVANLSKYLSTGFETKVLAGYKEPDEASSEYLLKDLGVDYTIVPNMQRAISPLLDYKAYKYILNQMNNYAPAIVHTHAAKAGALGRLAAINATIKPKVILHTYHGNVFDGYFSPLKTKIILGIERYLATKSNAIISISETQKKDLVEKYKIAPADKIHVIPLGFDLQKFQTAQEQKREQFRNYYHLQENTVAISITGRLAPVKNHILFIDAVSYCKSATRQVFKVFIVGDGDQMEIVQHYCLKKGLSICLPSQTNCEADIIFTSWRKDIDTINAGSDIVALSSLNEGTPVSIIEAMAAGKAVVCTNVGGVSDVVKHEKNGLLSSLDVVNFSQQLLRLIDNDSLRTTLSHDAAAQIPERFGYTRLINDMEALYNKLLC